jgi:hypothetical protein
MSPVRVMIMGLAQFFMFLALQTAMAQPQETELPENLFRGFELYKAEGPRAALEKWVEGGPLEGRQDLTGQANALRTVQDFYGPYVTHHIVAVRALANSTKFIYVLIDHENGPLFCKFTAFKGSEGWHIVNFDFNTDAEEIWPESLLQPETP